MLKLSILLNSSVTFLILLMNFAFKIYLSREFSQENLVIYYTITDFFSLLLRSFIGYKDALTTIYNQSKYKFRVMRNFTIMFTYLILFISFIILPISVNYYLSNKISITSSISWWYISILFISMNAVAYYGYLFLVTKHYKLISINDMLRGVLFLGTILFLYELIGMQSDYKTLILASILSNIVVLIYLIYKQKKFLSKFGYFSLIDFKLATIKNNLNKKFIKLTFFASANYFIYGILLFAPVYVMIESGSIGELANFQVVARSIYFALVSVFSWPLGRFMFPEFSSLISKKQFLTLEKLKIKFIKILALFAIIIIPSCWLLSEIVIDLIFPIDYHESYKIINILIVALPFVMYENFSESIIKAYGKYKEIIIVKLVGVFTFVISYILLKYNFIIDMPSIYSFVLAMIGIFLVALYYEKKFIKKDNLL